MDGQFCVHLSIMHPLERRPPNLRNLQLAVPLVCKVSLGIPNNTVAKAQLKTKKGIVVVPVSNTIGRFNFINKQYEVEYERKRR
jgi:hypothetical protein